MTESLSKTLLSQLSQFVAEQMGLHFPKERFRDLERGIGAATREFGFKDTESCIDWLVSSRLQKAQIEMLASHLTVGETYFFRDTKTFEVLETHILPELIESRRRNAQRVRIWSAACATGEEPYSIAISLARAIPDLRNWQVTILATDINPRFLEKASNGVYGKWSFRDAPSWLQKQYFKKTEQGRFEISPHIKKMVKFSYLNLPEDTYPSLVNDTNAMDIIFCRNVLMYFTEQQARKVVHRLYRSVLDGGWLITSPSEASHMLFSQFVTVNSSDIFLYRKQTREPQPTRGFLSEGGIAGPKSVETSVASPLPLEFIFELDPHLASPPSP